MGSVFFFFFNVYKGVNKPTSHKQKEKLKEAKEQRFLKSSFENSQFYDCSQSKIQL